MIKVIISEKIWKTSNMNRSTILESIFIVLKSNWNNIANRLSSISLENLVANLSEAAAKIEESTCIRRSRNQVSVVL